VPQRHATVSTGRHIFMPLPQRHPYPPFQRRASGLVVQVATNAYISLHRHVNGVRPRCTVGFIAPLHLRVAGSNGVGFPNCVPPICIVVLTACCFVSPFSTTSQIPSRHSTNIVSPRSTTSHFYRLPFSCHSLELYHIFLVPSS
jgi:hypothetical protein